MISLFQTIAAAMDGQAGVNDIMNVSDQLVDNSSENSSVVFTHHPSLLSAYESELQFDESTYQHETEPYKSQVCASHSQYRPLLDYVYVSD